tara:strand:- start:154 stop:387 length:234 start_codon:yes stop_codon:yes gene_type:complete
VNIGVYDVTFYKTDKDGNPVTDDQGNIIKYVHVGAELGAFSWNEVVLPSLDDDCHTYIRESHRDQAREVFKSTLKEV